MPQVPFSPERDGFSFNNTWHLAEPDKKRYQRLLLAFNVIGIGFFVSSKRWFGKQTKWGMAALLQLGMIIAYRQLTFYTFGLCGGLSFTELDYFRARQPLPLRGVTIHPSKSQQGEHELRAYIWARTLDSLRLNTLRVLIWMGLGHLHPQRHAVMMAKTRVEIDKLKTIIDTGSPWPICLIGTTWSPFRNHQVLAVGYDEHANGITLAIHDSNCPDKLSHIRLEFGDRQLMALESCASQRRGPVQAIFCETYHFSQPPRIPKP